MSEPDYDFDDDYNEPDEDDDLDECGLTSDGQCMLAGSEHCDFSCSMRDSEFFAGSKAWREKHRPKRKSKQMDLPLTSPPTDGEG